MDQMRVCFQTPMTLKSQGEFLTEFDIEAMIRGILRRIYMMDCFEGIEVNPLDIADVPLPVMEEQNVIRSSVKRYSNRQDMHMVLRGIRGEFVIRDMDYNGILVDLFLAGELLHVGKNTSFGFGRYVLVSV